MPNFWDELWHTPQAIQWERLCWVRQVARYAMLAAATEWPEASMMLLTEVRQMEDRLGLNPMSLLRLRWEITDDAEDTVIHTVPVKSTRPRLKVVAEEYGPTGHTG